MGVKLVHINKVGTSGDIYLVREFHAPVDPGFGGGIAGSGRPDNSLPGSSGGNIDNSLPGSPGHPDNRPPGKPPTIAAGETLVLVRDSEGVWHYASIDASTPPPKPVPVPPPEYPSGQPVPPVPTPT